MSSQGIAIIGMACVFPEAPSLDALWRNIVRGVDAVADAPPAWDAQRYLDSDRIKTAAGGWLRDLFRFNPTEFGIMPSSIDGGEPDQFLALKVARDALGDAGYLQDHDHTDTGIVLGHSTYLHRGQGTLIQNHIVVDQTLDLLQAVLPELGTAELSAVRKALESKLPKCNTDIAPGLVPNVMTGRIANRLDLRGPNYLVDAACSSSLLAVGAAIDELQAGRSSLMLAGGVNASLPPEVSVIFTQLGALSGRGKVRPFETGSDGTLLGEGLGVVALKRLDDALRDGDRIYAVVRGVGQASDGRGKGLLAPTEEGETLAIRRAYDQTGVDPKTVGLIEAHGTGIPLGDKTEIAALRNVFGGGEGAAPHLPVGSIKSMISHCIPAAGIAGLIKTALAVHHKVLPPTLCDDVNPDLGIAAPLYVNTEAAPWIQAPGEVRRAGINSFGFGGINTHAIVEEAPAAAPRPRNASPWACELCVFSAGDRAELTGRLEAFQERLAEHPDWTLDAIAAALAEADEDGPCRLAVIAKDRAALAKSLSRAVGQLRKSDKTRWATRNGLVFSEEPLGGAMAFVFPGEGAQYLGMLSDLAMVFDDVRQWLDVWAGLYGEEPGKRRTDIAFPPSTGLTEAAREHLDVRLNAMDVGSEAVFIGGQAMHALLRRLGVAPDVMLGHSSGESSALAAAHAIPWNEPGELAGHVRLLHAVYRRILDDGKIPTGSLMAVGALTREAVQEQIDAVDPSVVVAMHNCRDQLVLYGTAASIETLFERLAGIGGICQVLPFDRGYHTADFAGASAAFRDYYDDIDLGRPEVPLYSCATADRFPEDVASVRDLAAAQWSTTVRFQETVERMVDDGVTTFVEVGPSGNLTSFINNLLAGSRYLAVATNARRRGGLEQLLTALGHLYVEERPLVLARLFEGRAIAAVDLAGGRPGKSKELVLDNTMPKIRFTDDEVAELRALVPVPEPAPAPASVSSAVAEEPVSPPVNDVMPEYFGLMQSFLEHQSNVMQAWQSGDAPGPVPTPFLDAIVEQDAEHLVADCSLDIERDAFLRDHVLSGTVSVQDPTLTGLSCVPLMVSLEIMAEACALLAGSPVVRVIENVRAHGWIALDQGATALQVRAEVVDADAGLYRAELHGPTGLVVQADIGFQLTELRCPELPPLSEHRPSVWRDHQLYTSGMFHGPIFQSVRHLDGWDWSGIDARLSPCSLDGFFTEGDRPALVLNPVLLDAVGQVAAYWIAQYAGVEFNSFPSTIERIELYAHCPEDVEGLRLLARQQPLDPNNTQISAARGWDFECLDAEDRPLLRITNLQNVFFSVPKRFYEVRRDPLGGWLGRPTLLEGRDDVTLWELEMLPEAFCSQSENMFMRILAHVYLSAEELQQWHDLSSKVRRRREWLLGRACIKEGVRYWIYQQSGELLHPTDIVVVHDELGAPYVDGWWRGTLADAPSVSLTHDDTTCLAAVADALGRVGIDRELVGRIRRPELVAEALTPTERAVLEGLDEELQQDRLLRIWCAKEAAAKFLGLGLQGTPAAFEVQFIDEETAAAWVGHVDRSVYVDLIADEGSIIALASEGQQGTL